MKQRLILGLMLLSFMVLSVKTRSNDTIVRKFPYPYSAMLSICSDIDDTTPYEFESYHRFLNTTEKTQIGQGLGLDVADSFWFFNMNDRDRLSDAYGRHNPDVMSVFQKNSTSSYKDAQNIAYYFRVGWIDTLHSFGDFNAQNNTRSHFIADDARIAYREMERLGIHPTVWVNHGNAANIQNFGNVHASYQQGDRPGSAAYHLDLPHPFRFVWNSSFYGQLGCDYPLYQIELRNGERIWGFQRCTGEYKDKKPVFLWSAYDLQQQLTRKKLDAIVRYGQYSIVAQHLGNRNTYYSFGEPQISALRLLKQYSDEKKILVARTSRLLQYALSQRYVSFSETLARDQFEEIRIRAINDPVRGEYVPTLDELRGLTFYVRDPSRTRIYLKSTDITRETIGNPADLTGMRSISIRWFSPDTTDYARTKPIRGNPKPIVKPPPAKGGPAGGNPVVGSPAKGSPAKGGAPKGKPPVGRHLPVHNRVHI